jgi:hypothetical protein
VQFIVEYPDGMKVIMSTAEEVVELRRASGLAGMMLADPKVERTGPTNAPRPSRSWETLCKLVVEPKFALQHKILAAVKGHPKGISIDDLMRALSITTAGGIGARIAGVGRLAKAAGFGAHELLVATGKGGQRGYLPGEALATGNLPPVPEPGGKR